MCFVCIRGFEVTTRQSQTEHHRHAANSDADHLQSRARSAQLEIGVAPNPNRVCTWVTVSPNPHSDTGVVQHVFTPEFAHGCVVQIRAPNTICCKNHLIIPLSSVGKSHTITITEDGLQHMCQHGHQRDPHEIQMWRLAWCHQDVRAVV